MIDEHRNETDERKAREQETKQKQLHKEIDEVRDKTPKQREMHKYINKKRNKPEA